MKRSLLLLVFVAVWCLGKSQIPALKDIKSPEPEIGVVEHLNTYIPDDIMVVNTKGETQSIKSLIDKPTVIMLVYYRCPGICSPLMTSVADIVDKTDLVLNKDYQILTVSFDAREGTDLAAKKRTNYLNLIKKDIDQEGWKFFTADSLNISKLTKVIGFNYKRSGNDFMHPGLLTMVSPDAKITRYLQGTY
ncbi:MAG: SCO family protein, partial [Chloroflexota bacterium]